MSSKRTEITGAQRAAAFLLSMDKQAAANVLKHIDESVIVEVVEAMGHVEPGLLAADSQRALDKEFVRALQKPRGSRVRSEADLRDMLEQTLGRAQAEALHEKINQRLLHERPFLALEKHQPEHLAKVLTSEAQSVAALVLAHMDPSLAAEVLAHFPPELALEVVQRMAALHPPPFGTLVGIAKELATRVEGLANGPAPPDPARRLKTVAEILTYTEPAVEKTVLEGLGAADAKVAESIRNLMFTWEDLADVDKRNMQKILAAVDSKTLAIALKACSPPVETNIMANLSQRVREMIKDEREIAGPMPMAEVLKMREEVMKAVRGLMESGDFKPSKAGEELVT
jgi:flagellar motor switch protein FliG